MKSWATRKLRSYEQRIDLFFNCTTPAASQSGFQIYFGSKNRHGNDCSRHTPLREGGAHLASGRGNEYVGSRQRGTVDSGMAYLTLLG